MKNYLFFSIKIVQWYQIHKRNLPWRAIDDPYFIWLSEVILQQTRVSQGMDYYLKFIKNYPTVFDLARASEQEVLNDWQGLGYYSRARNLHQTAKHIVENLKGVFPSSYSDLIKLKGIGPYTASAIASFAFKEAKALVDGNVYRVLSRFFDIDVSIDSTVGKKEFQQLADLLILEDQPDVYNQAIMEFGALQCIPSNPDCNACVLNSECLSFMNNTVNLRPVKAKKIIKKLRYFYFGVFLQDGYICLQKRMGKDIWQHLFQFPMFETKSALSEQEISNYFFENYFVQPTFISREVTHILTHQTIIARFVHFDLIPQNLFETKIAIQNVDDYPLPKLLEKYMYSINFKS